ncbi:MAG: hypothetical protein EOP49_22005 [Sphingobacteriales bacterium]|nr:MAG: hypothetical protein EOP49_22005 [Sphingobacteriales bacterium]
MTRYFLIFILATSTVYSQPTVYTENPTSPPNSVQSANPHFQRMRTLLKVGGTLPLLRQSSFNGYYAAVALDVTVERKLVHGLTVVAGLENAFGLSMRSRNTKLYSLEIPLGLRYYFSLTPRQKQRADRHSFFSPYVAFQTHNVLFSRVMKPSRLEPYSYLPHRRNNDEPVGKRFDLLEYAYLQVGSQHQLFRKKGYLDVNLAIPVPALNYNKHDYTVATPALINIKLGFNLNTNLRTLH